MLRRGHWLILIGVAALFLYVPRPARAQLSPAIYTDSDEEEVWAKAMQLEGVLQNWWKASADGRPLPPQLAELTSPLIGAVTSVAPKANWRFGRILKELWLTGVIAAIVAVLCGLPFHLLAYLFSTPAARAGRHFVVHSPGAGWYVVCVAVVLRAIALIPLLRYTDRPFVEALTLGAPPPPVPSSPSPSPKSETGTVLTR